MDRQSEGRIHIGRQSTLSGSEAYDSSPFPSEPEQNLENARPYDESRRFDDSYYPDERYVDNRRTASPYQNNTNRHVHPRQSDLHNSQSDTRYGQAGSHYVQPDTHYETSREDHYPEMTSPVRETARQGDSVWAESRNTRVRRAARQGTARDARRTMQRHEIQSHRTPNRQTVYNTGGGQNETEMFQAVAAGDHAGQSSRRGGYSALDGINSRGSWHSSNGSTHPALREHHRSNFLSIALPVVIVILLIAAIALGIHSCVSG